MYEDQYGEFIYGYWGLMGCVFYNGTTVRLITELLI